MDTRFAHLRQRDTSVSMLRVKLSRRRSQSQKENRDRVVNTRRQLEKVPEMDASIMMTNLSTVREKTQDNALPAKSTAVEERLKQLERWKERKVLEKEKEKRDKEHKGVFKTGLYHPKDTFVFPAKRAKETKMNTTLSQSTRVTRSMKQQQQPLKTLDHNALAKKAPPAVERSTRTRGAPVKPAPVSTKVCAVETVVRALPTRAANRPPVTAAPAVKDKPKDKAADVRITRSRGVDSPVAPPSVEKSYCKVAATVAITAEPPVPTEQEEKAEEDMVVDHEPADSVPADDASSFAPQNFVFQAPVGLSNFKFEPLTPRSADVFLTPTFGLPPVPLFNIESQTELSEPSPAKSPRRSPPHTYLTPALQTPGSSVEPKHDVPYFRSEIVNETDHLSTLCVQWECKVEDESIPEEMRDRMRTAVGQARLLMKERFHQFSGLVDDCELGRGEKITTCTDLQGFWDMVYYQVEDVHKKFEALREAEGRGWVEEHKPPPRQRKVVKKTVTAPAKPAGTKVGGAKSRLAAAKAAMKARQQAAEAEREDAEDVPTLDPQDPQPQADPPNGGFLQVESPAKQSGSVRRSSRLSVAAPPPASPSSNYLTPRRMTRRSLALAQTPVQGAPSPARSTLTPAALRLTLDDAPESRQAAPLSFQERETAVNVSLCFSPVKEVTSEDGSPAPQTDTSPAPAPEPSTDKPVHSIPSICVMEDKDAPDEEADLVLPISPRVSLSLCESPQAPGPSMSFTLSPCVSPSEPPITSSLSPPPPAAAAAAEQSLTEATPSRFHTPDNSAIEEMPGLDFERYLQPSQRCSLSPPRGEVTMETTSLLSSPMAVDVAMESPTALPAASSVLSLHSPQSQTAECDLLLFTPDLKDRIRQSVCPNDLMVFTPPS